VNSEAVETLREIHHRIKNSLQLVASILNMQARKHRGTETEKILIENTERVLAIAAIHDIMTQTQDQIDRIRVLSLLERLVAGLRAFIPEEKQIQIDIQGDDVELSGSQASAVAMVVNELITNALEHAFEGRQSGCVSVTFNAGQLFHSVTVSDDGNGFDPARLREGSLGLDLVEATVHDRLHGQLKIHSDAGGSRVSFDIKIE
jgi:two-component sensor histidine kinase